jgi:hypothetical protein
LPEFENSLISARRRSDERESPVNSDAFLKVIDHAPKSASAISFVQVMILTSKINAKNHHRVSGYGWSYSQLGLQKGE